MWTTTTELELGSLEITVFFDSSFENTLDHRTTIDYAIILEDEAKRTNWFTFSSYKCRRIVRPVLGGKTNSFADRFDATLSLRYRSEQASDHKLPTTILSDPKAYSRKF